MDITAFAKLAASLDRVTVRHVGGMLDCRYHGRLVARQLDDTHVVIRMAFDVRDLTLRQFPETFSVPPRYVKHMMIVADIATGDEGAIEDAVVAAWRLQVEHDNPEALG